MNLLSIDLQDTFVQNDSHFSLYNYGFSVLLKHTQYQHWLRF